MVQFSATQIAHLFKLEPPIGNPDITINSINAVEDAKQTDLAFLFDLRATKHLESTDAGIIIIPKSLKIEPLDSQKTTFIRAKNVRLLLAQMTELIQKNLYPPKTGISKKSSFDKSVKIGNEVFIDDFSSIGEQATVGNKVQIMPHVSVGKNSTIGDGTVIHSGVRIYDNSVIGKNCIIHSGAVIGSDGFGFEKDESGVPAKIYHFGNVIIEDKVEVGANTTIDRAIFGSTKIKKNTKLDNLIQVAHNVEIGENCYFAALTAIAGSTKIGDNCMIGGQTGISGHLKIGNNVTIGAKSGIARNVKDGEILLGAPAVDFRKQRKNYIISSNLTSLYDRVNNLEKEIKQNDK